MTDAGEALVPGTRLDDLEIERVLGAGGFGITYLARDVALDVRRAVKEYLPREWATRRPDGTVGPRTGADAEDYQWGLRRFIEEARILARFDNRHLVRVHRVFEARGTAYMVMEHVDGWPLKAEGASGPLTEVRVRGVLGALANGLVAVHGAGLLHRDIKPTNVMVRRDGVPVLIDFGAARQAMGEHSRSVTAVLTPGYAPIEQYSARGNQGPWTDIYGLGALAYWALSGKVPPDATLRVRRDPLVPVAEAARTAVSGRLAAAVDQALAVDEEDRPQSLAEWAALLAGGPAEAERRRAGETEKFAVAGRQVEFAWIPAGSFWMGSASGRDYETPVREVEISRGFWLGTREVTQGEWEAVMGNNPSRFKNCGSECPVECVSWNDVQEFIAKLNAQEGGTAYRLPTEAEWEYAARAGTTGERYDRELGAIAWYDGNSGDKTHPVGEKRANAWGLHDMLGNVWEWVQDWYGAYPGGDVKDPTGASSGLLRVSRGGSWYNFARLCRSAFRFGVDPGHRNSNLGFRLCRNDPLVRVAEAVSGGLEGRPAEAERRQAGETKKFAVGGRQVEFAWIPAGSFRMGSARGVYNESPVREVEISRGFWLGTREVTQGEWEAVMGNNPSHFKNCGSECPVERVSWNDVQKFIWWLNVREGGTAYRLPTEAEWEYAARAGTTGERYDRTLGAIAWYDGNSGGGTHPVGAKKANAWGLYDMLGNVWEWVQDWYGAYPGGDVKDPTGASSGLLRVSRGGSWYNFARLCRSADRNGNAPGYRSFNLGFRLVRTD